MLQSGTRVVDCLLQELLQSVTGVVNCYRSYYTMSVTGFVILSVSGVVTPCLLQDLLYCLLQELLHCVLQMLLHCVCYRCCYTVEVPLPESLFQLMPPELQQGAKIRIVPVLFNIGINEQATLADK